MTEFFKIPKQSKNFKSDLITNKIMKINKFDKSYFSIVCSDKLNDFFCKNIKKNPFYIYGKKLNI